MILDITFVSLCFFPNHHQLNFFFTERILTFLSSLCENSGIQGLRRTDENLRMIDCDLVMMTRRCFTMCFISGWN